MPTPQQIANTEEKSLTPSVENLKGSTGKSLLNLSPAKTKLPSGSFDQLQLMQMFFNQIKSKAQKEQRASGFATASEAIGFQPGQSAPQVLDSIVNFIKQPSLSQDFTTVENIMTVMATAQQNAKQTALYNLNILIENNALGSMKDKDLQNIAMTSGIDFASLQALQQSQKSNDGLVDTYAELVNAGKMKLSTVPAEQRDDVVQKLDVESLPSVVSSSEVGGGTEGLSSAQIIAGASLAKELFSASAIRTKDGYQNYVVPIYDEMRTGKNIDTIADESRLKGQSVEFTGTIREAAQQITSKLSAKQTQTVFDKLDDVITSGDTGKVRDFLKKIAIDNASAGADEAQRIKGSERTVEFLDEIYQDLADYEEAGGDTNIFIGTVEQAMAKAGTVKNSALREVAVKIAKARQQYRRSMTGVAFSPGENKEYDAIFPNINKTNEFNTAVINGLRESLRGDVDFFYGFAMGEDAYQELFKGGAPKTGGVTPISDGLSDEEAYQEYLNIQQ